MTKYKRKAAIHKYIKGPILSLPLSILMSPSFDRLRKEKPTFSGKREKRGLYRAKKWQAYQRRCERGLQYLAQSIPQLLLLRERAGERGDSSFPPTACRLKMSYGIIIITLKYCYHV